MDKLATTVINEGFMAYDPNHSMRSTVKYITGSTNYDLFCKGWKKAEKEYLKEQGVD